MAQINFYVTKADEANLLTYIRARGGYLARDVPTRGTTEIVHTTDFEHIPNTTLHVLEGSVFPSANLNNRQWRSRVKRGMFKWTSEFAGPSITYQHLNHSDSQIVHARFWCEYSALGFYGAGPWKGGPAPDFAEQYAPSVRAFDNLYKGISRYIRKRYRRDGQLPNTIWHGPDSDRLEKEGVPKSQFIEN